MIEQLESSINFIFECSKPSRIDASTWLKQEIESTEKDIDYYVEKRNLEILRANERTEWIQNLKVSLENFDEQV